MAVFATPIEEPWDRAIHAALLKAEDKLGIEYEWTDNVQPTQFEKTLRRYCEARFDIIMGDAFAAEEIVRRVARDYPGIVFCFGSGLGPVEPNFSVFDNWIHEPAYLAGMIAGRITKSNVIGVVGGYPVPEVNRIVNAFKLGAEEVNPSIQLKIIFIGSWFDPPKAKTATHVLIDQDVDVVYAERAGVIEACEEKGIPVIGNLIDQHDISPKHVVTSIIWDVWPTVRQLINRVRTGTYNAENYGEWSMMAKGGARLAPFYAWEQTLGNSILQQIQQRQDSIYAGRFRVPVIESIPESD